MTVFSVKEDLEESGLLLVPHSHALLFLGENKIIFRSFSGEINLHKDKAKAMKSAKILGREWVNILHNFDKIRKELLKEIEEKS